MSFEESMTSQDSTKSSSEESQYFDLIVHKPDWLSEKCPVSPQDQRFPEISEKIPIRRKFKKEKSDSQSSVQWLKPGVSLPKLEARVSPQRLNLEEPFGGFHFTPLPSTKKGSSSVEHVSSNVLSNVTKDPPSPLLKISKRVFDCISEAVGPSKCQFLLDIPSSELECEDLEIPKETSPEASHALKQWESWMKRKKHLQDHLSKNLGIRPCDLLMNQTEKFRKVYEDKLLFSYSQVPEPDKWRGHPYWWIPEPRLKAIEKDSVDCPRSYPEYCVTKTKLEQGVVPQMEFIDVPAAIQKEKGLVCDPPKGISSQAKFREGSTYRRMKANYYKKQRKKVKEHEIQMDKLAVVGIKMPQKLEDDSAELFINPNSPQIFLTEPNEEESVLLDDYQQNNLHSPKVYLDQFEKILCLVINEEKIMFKPSGDWRQDSNLNQTWEINFGLNEIGILMKKHLKVENRGNIAVSYNWFPKKSLSKRSLNSLQLPNHEPWFFFNKNPGIFLPGQTYDLEFYHYTKKPGIRTEIWYLRTSPKLFKHTEDAAFVLSAVAVEESFESEMQAVESYLQKRVAQSIARLILDNTLRTVLHPLHNVHEIEYRSLILPRDLFEYHNQKHYYHSKLVQELNEIYLEIPLNENNEWDFSIKSLVELTTMYVELRKSQESLLRRIAGCAAKLLRPKYVLEKQNKKYSMSYQIICKMVNYIEDDYNYFRNCILWKQLKHEANEESQLEDFKEIVTSDLELDKESKSSCSRSLYQTRSVNLVHFQQIFYLKTYLRVCDAVQEIAGALETSRCLEPWKKINYRNFKVKNIGGKKPRIS